MKITNHKPQLYKPWPRHRSYRLIPALIRNLAGPDGKDPVFFKCPSCGDFRYVEEGFVYNIAGGKWAHGSLFDDAIKQVKIYLPDLASINKDFPVVIERACSKDCGDFDPVKDFITGLTNVKRKDRG